MTVATERTPGRLRASADISAVFAARQHRAGRHLVVHARDRGDAAPPRIAVVASKRVGNAVRRNRAKRLLREAVRALSWRSGHDVVLTARVGCPDRHVRDVVADLADAAGRRELLAVDAP